MLSNVVFQLRVGFLARCPAFPLLKGCGKARSTCTAKTRLHLCSSHLYAASSAWFGVDRMAGAGWECLVQPRGSVWILGDVEFVQHTLEPESRGNPDSQRLRKLESLSTRRRTHPSPCTYTHPAAPLSNKNCLRSISLCVPPLPARRDAKMLRELVDS